jgi:hypothetical protein
MTKQVRLGDSVLRAPQLSDKHDELEAHCEEFIDLAFVVGEYKTSTYTFVLYDCDFSLELRDRVWTLELAPTTSPGSSPDAADGAPRNARRSEQYRRSQRKVAPNTRTQPTRARAAKKQTLKRVLCNLCIGWRRGTGLSPFFASIGRHLGASMHGVQATCTAFINAHRWRIRAFELRIRSTGYIVGNFITRNRRELMTGAPEFGLRLERHLFGVELGLPMVMGTWVRIDPGFDRLWDVRMFGIRAVETDWI